MIDDYEKRMNDQGYWENSEDFMYGVLKEKWLGESVKKFKHGDGLYDNHELLLNLVSQNFYDWSHYFSIPKFQTAKLDTLEGNWYTFREPVEDWISALRSGTVNLVFVGNNGTGKTHAAMAACRYMTLHGIQRRDDDLYMPTSRFLDCVDAHNILNDWNKDQQALEAVSIFKNVPLLLIDDLGAVATSAQAAIANIVSIISTRYNLNLPTIITSNVEPDKLIELYGSTMVRRLITNGSIVHYS